MLRRAVMEARRGTYRWRLGCAIAIGSRLLSTGHNKFRCHPRLNHLEATWHAEEVALRRLRKRNIKGSDGVCRSDQQPR